MKYVDDSMLFGDIVTLTSNLLGVPSSPHVPYHPTLLYIIIKVLTNVGII